MEPMLPTVDDLDDDIPEVRTDEDILIYEWRAEQLRRLGLPAPQAYAFAELVDWHEIAALVDCGCPPKLALEIVR
jgi:hypothetical protein